MKRFKLFITLLTIAAMVLILTSCASKKDSDTAYDTSANSKSMASAAYNQEAPAAAAEYTSADTADQEVYEEDGSTTVTATSLSNSSALTLGGTPASSMEKIIRRVDMVSETQDFDGLVTTIGKEIKRLGGYVESSNISGKSYNSYSDLRSANILARIPKDKLDEFVGAVDDNSNVVNKQESTENVTLKYIETESRKKSLEIEQERLFAILEKADKLENIITLESRLSEIRYELQNYETQLRTYDNQVEYSTVSLTVEEVERMTPVQVKKPSVFTRIKTGLNDTMYNISEGFKNVFVWFAVNLLYILLWAVFITAVVLIIRRIYKRYERKGLTAASKEYPHETSKDSLPEDNNKNMNQ